MCTGDSKDILAHTKIKINVSLKAARQADRNEEEDQNHAYRCPDGEGDARAVGGRRTVVSRLVWCTLH